MQPETKIAEYVANKGGRIVVTEQELADACGLRLGQVGIALDAGASIGLFSHVWSQYDRTVEIACSKNTMRALAPVPPSPQVDPRMTRISKALHELAEAWDDYSSNHPQ